MDLSILPAQQVESQNTRIYKCESLTYSDDGLVQIAGSFTPITSDGRFEILNWDENTFEEELS